MKNEKPIYLKTVESRKEYLGERYFKTSNSSFECIQVCVTTGDLKKGRAHTFGVYVISKLTLMANYVAMGYAIPTTEKEYKKAFNKVIEYLK